MRSSNVFMAQPQGNHCNVHSRLEHAGHLAKKSRLHFIDSFSPVLVRGVASYALELFRSVPDLDYIYVPIGMGSGICGTIAARNALGLKSRIVGVVSSGAPAYALSFQAGKPVSTPTVNTMADGISCRVPNPEAVDIIKHQCRPRRHRSG